MRACPPLLAALLALGSPSAGAAEPPIAVSGIEGAAFLTSDPAAMRRFYGQGAGLAEEPAGSDGIRFLVGSGQWLEFRSVPSPSWQRRLQHVTLEVPDVGDAERDLRARGVRVAAPDSQSPGRVLQLEDPAGDRLEMAGPFTPGSVPSGARPFSDHLQHVGFAVPRALEDATVSFYRDTLGWPERVRLPGSDGRTALVKFLLPGRRRDLIELIFYDPPLNKWAAGAFDHVNFEVGDIDEAYRALRRGGIATQEKHLPEVNGEHLWAINIIDPELTRMEVQVLAPAREPIGAVSARAGVRALFDGATLSGWEGNTGNWRVEGGAIVAGDLARRQPHNEFLATTADYGNFDLRLQYRVEGTDGFVNGGVQFWSQRVPGGFEVSGYQADLGAGTDGNLYDESRRNSNLATAPPDVRQRVLNPGGWNDYRVRAEGAHIQIWLNGVRTVDYTETERSVPQRGKFALQIHGGAKTRVSYRGLELEPLP